MARSAATWRRAAGRLPAVALAATVGVVGSTVPAAAQSQRDNASITLEVVVANSSDEGAVADVIESVRDEGGVVLGTAPGVVLVDLPDAASDSFTDEMARSGALVRDPVPVDIRPEGTAVPQQFGPTTSGADARVNALAWHAAGYAGAGVRIGVIDFFDVSKYWNVAEHGPAPIPGVTAFCRKLGQDCTGAFFDGVNEGGEDHGVAVVEVIKDVAPNAEIFIGQATTITDYQALIDWFASNGVQIVNRSLGSRYDGPGDGRGPLGEVVAGATRRGITWINSGGNNGERRYYRNQVRLVGNRVAFGPAGTDTFLDFRGCVQLAGARWATDWDLPPASRTNYDIFLWNSPTGQPGTGDIVDSGTANQLTGAPPIEHLGEQTCPTTGRTLYLEVRHVAGDPSNDILEIADYGAGIAEYVQAPYSAAVPVVDSDDPGVIAVGSIEPPGGTEIAAYSSQGPTNDGRIAPDVTAASRFATQVFGTFSGTSASAAVVAGAAALLLDADQATPGHALGDLIRHTTIDRGFPGPDHVYGNGQFVLPAPPTTGVDSTPSTFVALDVPTRVLDTRSNHAIGPPSLIGDVWRGEILDLPIVSQAGLPANEVSAVAINVTSVAPDRASHIQVLPTRRATVGGFSNLNIDQPGQVRANFSIVPVGADGSISIYSIANGNVIIDLLGWFNKTPGASAGGRFVELPGAQRVLDSRFQAPIQPLTSGEIRNVPLPSGVDPNQVDALVVSVTATRITAPGWVQAIPAGQPGAAGATSTLNVNPGDVVANAAIVPVGPNGVALTGFFRDGGRADVIVDVTGYITSDAAPPGTAGRYVAVRPDRGFDSRRSTGALGDRQQVVVDARPIGVPADARGVVWNVTAAGTARAGHATGWAADTPMPATSLLNWSGGGQIRAAGAITAVSTGRGRFAVEDGPANQPGVLTHLVVDVFGYFT